MFAAIMKSMTPLGVRSTVVIPVNGDAPLVYSRLGESRGIAGAWVDGDVNIDNNEMTVGLPVAIPMTPVDYKDLLNGVKPTQLLQRLARTMQGVTTVTLANATATFDDIYTMADEDATQLQVFVANINQQPTPQPVVQVIPQPQVIAPVITLESAPIQEHIDTEEVPMQFQSVTSPTDVEAVLTIPGPKKYVERVKYGKSETEIYDYARSTQQNVLLTGHAGTGKTSSARNYAHKRNLPFVVIECTQQIDQSVTQGRFVPTGVGTSMKWKYSQLATAIQQPSVILINELTRMPAKAASLFLRLFEERELVIEPLNEVLQVHPECIFIADQNTGLGYTGTVKQDNALLDRFNLKIEFDYDINLEKQFISSPTLLQFAHAIREATEMQDEFSIPMSSRLLINFEAQAKALGLEFAINAMLNSFPKNDGEREGVKMRLDADLDTIAEELGVDKGSYSVI